MEKIMVVKRKILFGENNERLFQGFKSDSDKKFLNLINVNYKFIDRTEAEINPEFIQIIPYIIIRNNSKFFVMNYIGGKSERRHINQYNLGVGGHINPVDHESEGNTLIMGAEREFREEVNCTEEFNPKIIGFVNNELDMYNKVHIGVVFLHDTRSGIVDINEEEKHKMEGKMSTVSEIKEKYTHFGEWSKYIIDRFL